MTEREDIDLLSRNKELAEVLALIGNYYAMARDTYRARAFLTASDKIAVHPIAILSGAQARSEIAGVGESIQSTIDEYLATGGVQRLRELETRFNERREVIDFFLSFYGIGPATAVKFYNQGLRTLEDLWFKANLTDAQKVGILWRDHIDKKIPRDEMDIINQRIGEILDPHGIKWEIAGSYRRGEPSSNDIDLLVQSSERFHMEDLVTLLEPYLTATLALGPSKFMGMFRLSDDYYGHRIDIRIIPSISFAPALMYFTGSQRFNILMRQRAIDIGMLLNEYGVYRGDEFIYTQEETDIFAALGVVYMAPEERTRTLNALPLVQF